MRRSNLLIRTFLPILLVLIQGSWLVFAAGLVLPLPDRPATAFLAGPQLERRLQDRVTVGFTEQTFRRVLRSLSQGYQIAVFLDRRVDPDRVITLVERDISVREVLTRLAELGEGEVVWVGPVAYVAPREKGWQALAGAELCQQLTENFPPPQRQAWQQVSPLAWPDFSTPRDLIVSLVRQIGWDVTSPELIPHDLWAAQELPPLALAEKLGLLLAPFDLRPVPDSSRRKVELVPIDSAVRWRRMYRWPLPQIAGPEALTQLVPKAQWEVRGNWLVVLADWSEHRRLMELGDTPRRRPEPPKRPGSERLYTIRQARGRFESVMRQLATALGLEIRFDYEGLTRAGIAPDTPVAFSVENATTEELLRAATKAAGCDFRLEGNVLFVFPAKR
ncbi:MAG: hypothetical protein NZ899_05510 [Thermoguttaceae bacterium]|nr:hypothetical protein [Thermoguttaceae bacterium]MDW8078227.1 hypothetical protein [Thermoguttaceae bacterium]